MNADAIEQDLSEVRAENINDRSQLNDNVERKFEKMTVNRENKDTFLGMDFKITKSKDNNEAIH